jgi:hypothetical protein
VLDKELRTVIDCHKKLATQLKIEFVSSKSWVCSGINITISSHPVDLWHQTKDIFLKGVGDIELYIHLIDGGQRLGGGQCWTKSLEPLLTAKILATQLKIKFTSSKSWDCSGIIITISRGPVLDKELGTVIDCQKIGYMIKD